MTVRLQGCHIGFTTTPTIFSGSVVIRLVTPSGSNGLLWDAATNKYVPCGQIAEYDIDTGTGCWTSDPLICNSDLTPAGSYYEIGTVINGVNAGMEFVQLDCDTVVYADPTDVSSIAIVSVNPTATPLFQQALAAAMAANPGSLGRLAAPTIARVDGPLTTTAGQSTSFPRQVVVEELSAVVDTEPTGSPVTFDVHLQPAATLIATGTVATGQRAATFTTITPTTVPTNSWLETTVTTIGSTAPGEGLTVTAVAQL